MNKYFKISTLFILGLLVIGGMTYKITNPTPYKHPLH